MIERRKEKKRTQIERKTKEKRRGVICIPIQESSSLEAVINF